jgi:hypothetical protein
MSAVSQIYEQLAQTAGQQELARGNRYAALLQGIANVPGQILDDRARQAQLDLQRAGEAQRLAIANRADQRAQADQTYQDQQRAAALAHDRIVAAGLAAAMGPDGDPGTFDAKAAAQKVADLGRPEAIYDVIAKHRELQPAPLWKKADEVGINRDTLQPIPGLGAAEKIPEVGTPGYEIWLRGEELKKQIPPAAGGPALAAPPTVTPGGPSAPAPSTSADLTPTGAPVVTPPPTAAPLTRNSALLQAYADQRAAVEAAKDPVGALYTKRASGATLTPAETAQIAGYEAKKNADDAPVTIKTIENGKMVEKVLTRAEALKTGVFASQPPASVQVQNLPPPPAQPPSKAEIAMANYMVPTPSPRSFATPAGKAMMDRILTVNPDFDASLYSVRAPTRKAYTTGPQGQQLTAMNTAIEHLDQLQAAADALQNGTFKPGNAAYNALADLFGSGAPTSFATIKEKVDKELDAVASKGVPTVSGAAAQKAIGGVSSSPESIKTYIDTSIRLLGSSQNALRAPYQRVMGANAPFDPLTPEAKAVLVKRGFDPDNPTATVAPPATLAPNRTQRVVQNGVTFDVTTDANGKVVSSQAVRP